MPTIIDSLVLELGVDTDKGRANLKKFLEDLAKGKEEGRKSAQDMERSSKNVGERLSSLQSQALKLIGLFTAGMGLKEFVQQTVITDRTVGQLSNTLGISTETLSEWRGAAKLWGGSAEGISATIKSLTLDLAKFQTTGESQIIPYLRGLGIDVFDSMGHFKKATDLLLDISDAVQNRRLDPAQATYILQSLGADQATINAMLKGRVAMESFLKTAREAGTITHDDVVAADELTRAWNELEQASTSLGRTLLTQLSPALVLATKGTALAVKAIRDPIEREKLGAATIAGFSSPLETIGSYFTGSPRSSAQSGSKAPATFTAVSQALSKNAIEQYIADAARKRGIDPQIAIAVARSEGLNQYVGDRGSSFGPFQLHYGGVAGGGMAVSGLGDEFTRKTGLDARNPATVKSQIDFALDYAARHGWGPWHGWRGAPNAGIASQGGGGVVQHISVASVNISVPSGDAAAIGQGFRTSLARQGVALQANRGPE